MGVILPAGWKSAALLEKRALELSALKLVMSLNHSIERLDPLRIQPFHEMKRHNLGQINLCNKLISFLNLDLKSSDFLRPLHLEMEVY
uniref:Uncharacterized protein n=1 Tax=Rhizoctonia solani TaxID=456999 RepID=N0A6Z7_9AGAM|nr:hypothetical protein RSOL_m00910 [Rhizoctonia solani]AGK45411.1 hypothetical protein RSOL_m00910 [Rhizoctonia solani]